MRTPTVIRERTITPNIRKVHKSYQGSYEIDLRILYGKATLNHLPLDHRGPVLEEKLVGLIPVKLQDFGHVDETKAVHIVGTLARWVDPFAVCNLSVCSEYQAPGNNILTKSERPKRIRRIS